MSLVEVLQMLADGYCYLCTDTFNSIMAMRVVSVSLLAIELPALKQASVFIFL